MIRSLLRRLLIRWRKKTPEEKERMMFSLKIARSKIWDRVYLNLPEQLRNAEKIGRAIAEQINYAERLKNFAQLIALLIAFGSAYHKRPNGNASLLRSTPRSTFRWSTS